MNGATARVVAWNVCRGGGQRCARIVSALTSMRADVVVVSEFWPEGTGKLDRRLADAGFVHQFEGGDPGGGYTGLLVASRRPMARGEVSYPSAIDGHRFQHLVLDDWNIVGLLIPASERGSDRKQRLWRFIVDDASPRLRGQPTVLIGDFNTGLHHRDEIGATFVCADDLQALHDQGWRDVWTELHPDVHPPASWLSPKHANPFRLDHALLSPSAPPATNVGYPTSLSDGTSLLGPGAASDHCPVVVDLPCLSSPRGDQGG